MNANDGSVIVATGTAPGRGDRILVRCSGDGILAHADGLLAEGFLDLGMHGGSLAWRLTPPARLP